MKGWPSSKSTSIFPFSVMLACAFLTSHPRSGAEETAGLEKLTERIVQHEKEFFAQEKHARMVENHGLVPFWDRLNAASPLERFDVLAQAGLQKVTLGKEDGRQRYNHGIREVRYTGEGRSLDAAGWKALLGELKDAGYRIVHSDWHQERFEVDQEGHPVSDTRFTIQGIRREGWDRLEVKATIRVTWRKEANEYRPTAAKVLNGKVRRRSGPLAFSEQLHLNLETRSHKGQSLGLMDGGLYVRDLNGDRFPEVLVAGYGIILWNRDGKGWDKGLTFPNTPGANQSRVGLLADLDGDGIVDWLRDDQGGTAIMFHPGLKNPTTEGAFNATGIPVPSPEVPLKIPTAITGGDIDRDGDLDLFIGQYRMPYESMPKPYWDANDGYGNILLLNDGAGNFSDATKAAGLEDKRFRRTYSASFVDLDNDGDLDLVVVSDFCGVDYYLNDGTGQFQDVTDTMLGSPRTFGMSHTIADYDRDGSLDLFVTGMSSTTSRRLERMGAFPEGFDEANEMRSVMGYGNRMFMATGKGAFAEPSFKEAVARTGWSWGSASFDFDNDGDEDIYVGNGHLTGKSTVDYCTNFWCRDIYLLPGVEGNPLDSYLASIPSDGDLSWDGYQVNSLLMNTGGTGFQDLAFMLDAGFNYDTRQVIATDFDQNGTVDLLLSRLSRGMLTNQPTDDRSAGVTLYYNVLPAARKRDWIGVTLSGTKNVSPLGARIELETTNGIRTATVVSGDSSLCQHPPQKHFGIERDNRALALRVIWPDGSTTEVANPELKRYHPLEPPAADKGAQ